MKKKIEDELFKLADKIVTNREYLDVAQLKAEARNLYEKLCVLHFTEKHLAETAFEEPEVEISSEEPAKQFPEEQKEITDDRSTYFAPDGTEYNDSEAITEPNTEKIKNIVAEMPQETGQLDDLFARVNTEEKPPQQPKAPERAEKTQQKEEKKLETRPQPEMPVQKPENKPKPHPRPNPQPEANRKDFHDFGVDYDSLPKFEPVNQNGKAPRPKSLNDRLKKGITIGLNERLAFIKHLFEGNSTDYNRVLSQLNTFHTLEEAYKFIQLVVKPDYNNWEGKEQYEQQFLQKIENKFEN
jgi:signal recognition particle subunit SEC65